MPSMRLRPTPAPRPSPNLGSSPRPSLACSQPLAALGRVRTGMPIEPACRPPANALLRSRDRAFWQALAIARDLAGRSDPQLIAVADDVAHGVGESAQTE